MRIKLTRPAGVSVRRINTKYAGRRIKALVLSPEDGAENAPGVLWIHGGGYITGTKETVYMTRAVDLVTDHGAVIVAPDYGIAPIRPYPAALDDCYAALLWMHDHAEELCIDKERLAVGGVSAGGGLCAAVCMRARDEGSVKISFQLPLYPMLDDRDTESSRDNHGRIWNTKRNHLGWRMYLRKTDGLSRAASVLYLRRPRRAVLFGNAEIRERPQSGGGRGGVRRVRHGHPRLRYALPGASREPGGVRRIQRKDLSHKGVFRWITNTNTTI